MGGRPCKGMHPLLSSPSPSRPPSVIVYSQCMHVPVIQLERRRRCSRNLITDSFLIWRDWRVYLNPGFSIDSSGRWPCSDHLVEHYVIIMMQLLNCSSRTKLFTPRVLSCSWQCQQLRHGRRLRGSWEDGPSQIWGGEQDNIHLIAVKESN